MTLNNSHHRSGSLSSSLEQLGTCLVGCRALIEAGINLVHQGQSSLEWCEVEQTENIYVHRLFAETDIPVMCV